MVIKVNVRIVCFSTIANMVLKVKHTTAILEIEDGEQACE